MTTDKSETIEEWEARVAPTLDADDWLNGNALARGGYLRKGVSGGEQAGPFTVGQWRLFLAFRDRVAKGLSKGQRSILSEAAKSHHYGRSLWTDVEPWGGERLSAQALLRKGLLRCAHPGGPAWNEWRVTPFGREIARVQEARP